MSPIQSTQEGWRPTAGRINRSCQIQQQQRQSQRQQQQYTDQYSGTTQTGHRRLIQQSIHCNRVNSDSHWGHKLPKKCEDILRIGLQNVNSLPIKKSHCKNEEYINDIHQGKFDIFCATEINIAWHNMENEHNLKERFKGCLEFAKYVTSHSNDKNFDEKFQRGGTMITCSGSTCARIIKRY
jgi:hypothetical protein